MGYPTKVQLIKRKASEQWYINFPAAVAQAMEFDRGEVVEWVIEDKKTLVLHRTRELPAYLKKKRPRRSSESSSDSGSNAATPSPKSAPGRGRKTLR